MRDRCIHWLDELGQEHGDLVGKKCANLGELTRLGLQVPRGFAVGVDACRAYMELTGISGRLTDYFAKLGDELKRSFALQMEASRCAREMIRSAAMPSELGEQIEESYRLLCDRCGTPDVPVAVRSSGAVSMPGQMETYLQVRGSDEVKRCVLEVWGSAFNTRAIAFRLERGMAVERASIGVGVMKMVNARSAGVVITVDPLTGEADRVVIEGNWGLGESVASGDMTPDRFVVTKETGAVDRVIQRKTRWVVSNGTGTANVEAPEDLRDVACLTDEEIHQIAHGATGVERHFGAPQDMEWVIDRELPPPRNVVWVQARPAKYTPRTKAAETDYLVEQMARLFRR